MGMDQQGIQGVVLDAALLFCKSANGVVDLHSHAQTLLYRLAYSNLHVEILFGDFNECFTSEKENLVRSMVPGNVLHLKNCTGPLGSALEEIISAWAVPVASCILLSSCLAAPLKDELLNQGWYLCFVSEITLSNGVGKERTIQHLQDFLLQIASIKKINCHGLTIVGYTMKWSRERDFLKRGVLPLHLKNEHLSFLPINLDRPLLQQLEIVDIVLHKPTDEIISISLGEAGNLEDQVKFTDDIQQLFRFLHMLPHVCVVDPIERILPLVDRALTQEVLQGLSELEISKDSKIRSPKFVKVANFDNPGLLEMLKSCKVSLPAIVKPQMACGVPDSHKMAVVFRPEGYINLAVPTPSTIQEYIDHGSRQYKFYVIGRQIFHSIRESTPDAAMLAGAAGDLHVPAAIGFDSLRSLPVNFIDDRQSKFLSSFSQDDPPEPDLELVHSAATWLREKLKLTIFGFDVVVQLVTHDHVIVDVNFFPSFKDVDQTKAIPAFWEALHHAFTLHKEAKYGFK